MEASNILSVVTAQDFSAWLGDHHQTAREVWMVVYNKSSGKQALSTEDAIETALCYGWIDSRVKGIKCLQKS